MKYGLNFNQTPYSEFTTLEHHTEVAIYNYIKRYYSSHLMLRAVHTCDMTCVDGGCIKPYLDIVRLSLYFLRNIGLRSKFSMFSHRTTFAIPLPKYLTPHSGERRSGVVGGSACCHGLERTPRRGARARRALAMVLALCALMACPLEAGEAAARRHVP